MKRFVLLFFALAGFISSAAGQEQEITGFVYVSETPTPVPFASVWLCDPATGEPEYGTITAMNGWYDFGNVATDQTYQLKYRVRVSEREARRSRSNTFPAE